MDMKKLLESISRFEESEMDRSPGSPYDRGGADADYDRSPRPHKMVPNERGGKDMVKLTDPKEIEEYMAGYEDGEKSKGKQPENYDDDLDEGLGMKYTFAILDDSLIDKISDMNGAEVDPDAGSVETYDENTARQLTAFAKKNPGRLKQTQMINRAGMKPMAQHVGGTGHGPEYDLSEADLNEKAVSKQQQKFMGMVHAMQKGEKVKGASPELKKVAKDMSKKDAKDFASTKHKGLPKKVDESLTISATDNDAYSLMRMVSLAGVPGAEKVEPMEPYSPYSAHADMPVGGVIYDGDSTGCSAVNCSDSNCPTHGHDMMPMEEYANEPDESTCEVSSVTDNAGLGGLNGPKRQHPFAANKSDNPLDEVDVAERASKLAGMYNKFKGK
jgi:Protein of unknwon function (DUF3008)